MNNFESLVKGWAEERNLIANSTPIKQWVKLGEEMGEMMKHMFKAEDIRDDIGDQMVVLNVIAAQLGESVEKSFVLIEKVAEAAGNPSVYDMFQDMQDINRIANEVMFINAELGSALLPDQEKGVAENAVAYIGAYFAALQRMAEVAGSNIDECCEIAWQEIKDRAGKTTTDGAFIKDGDAA